MFSVLVNIPFLYAIFMGVASACSRKAVTVGSLTENRKLAGFQEPGLVSLLSKIEHTPCFLVFACCITVSCAAQAFFAGLLFTSGVFTSWEVAGCLCPVVLGAQLVRFV